MKGLVLRLLTNLATLVYSGELLLGNLEARAELRGRGVVLAPSSVLQGGLMPPPDLQVRRGQRAVGGGTPLQLLQRKMLDILLKRLNRSSIFR